MVKAKRIVSGEFALSDLTRLPRSVHIKLGASNGSGFVFCGSASSIDFEKIDADICDAYRQTIKNAKKSIESIEERGKTYEDYKMYVRRHNSSVSTGKRTRATQNGYEKWLRGLESRKKSAGKTKEEAERKLEAFTTLRNRKLMKYFASITENNTFVFIYEGEEAGDIWTTDEYNEVQRKKEKRRKRRIAAGA